MGLRLDLHAVLISITDHVYFQPRTNITLEYPCIVYKRDYAKTEFADNKPYSHEKRYMVTVIDRNPDSEIPDEVSKLPKSTFNRHYTADDLNHDVYQVFF